jgi:NAD(P)-dependent dehydrogenase (short-subunit alcohol dehydrogenase family)
VSVVLITGASTGIGNLTAKALTADGHTVYASMRSVGDRNAPHARELLDTAQRSGFDLRVVELDVQSHLRVRRSGTLLYGGSTTTVSVRRCARSGWRSGSSTNQMSRFRSSPRAKRYRTPRYRPSG